MVLRWVLVLLTGLAAKKSGLTQSQAAEQLVAAARKQIGVTVRYDPQYTRLPYPNGDVPPDRGVCTDVLIRALRLRGVDLQQQVHEDMARAFKAYPRVWGTRSPDRNIDHRRVLNLQRFFERKGKTVSGAFLPGDIITVTVPPRLPHIALVSDRRGPSGEFLIIHNIGQGAREEDALRAFPHTGHYRWF